MARIPKNHQHRQAHSGYAPVSLNATNKTDTASFVNGVASSINVRRLMRYASGKQLEFYSVLEAIRHLNHQANTRFPGRRKDIKDARFDKPSTSYIYNAAINPRKRSPLPGPLKSAIYKACNQPSFNDSLFQRVWELWPSAPLSIRISSSSLKATRIIPSSDLELSIAGLNMTTYPAALEAAMRATVIKRVKPGKTVIKELLHHTLLDIETGIVARERQILRTGMVATSLASRLYRGRTDIFQRNTTLYAGPLMAFVMDMSGSMGEYWPRALAVMGSVAHTLNRAGAPTICVGFAARDENIIYQFQDAEDTFDIGRFTIIDPPGGNADAVAVEYCRRKLLRMDSIEPKKKYIIVFSDEGPSGMVYYNSSGGKIKGSDMSTLNEALDLCKSSNVRTISVICRHDYGCPALLYETRTVLRGPEATLNSILEIMGVQ